MSRRSTLLAVISTIILSACGSIMHGTTQEIGVSSSPTGALVQVDNAGEARTPYIAKLSRKNNHIVKLTLPGYAPAELTVTRGVSGWVWGNIVFGGIIGLAVDAISGGLYKLTPNALQAELGRNSATVAPTKDGIYVILVQEIPAGAVKVGQLTRLAAHLGN